MLRQLSQICEGVFSGELCYGQISSTSECVGGIWVLSVFKLDITSLNKQPQYWSVWSNFTENEASQKSDEQF